MSVELHQKRNEFKKQFKKRCFDFSLEILKVSELLSDKKANRILVDQLIRSATSVGANVVEGGSSASRREFINYFQIALKSAVESLYWLALLKETNLDKGIKWDDLMGECTEIKKMIVTIIINTKSNSKL